MNVQQYTKRLEKEQQRLVNQWLRLARKNAYNEGYLEGVRVVAKGVGASINDAAAVAASKQAHASEIMASRTANKQSRRLYKLRNRK